MVGRATIMTGNDDLGQYPRYHAAVRIRFAIFSRPPPLSTLSLSLSFSCVPFCHRRISNFRTELPPLVVDESRSTDIRLPFVLVVDLMHIFALNYPSLSDPTRFSFSRLFSLLVGLRVRFSYKGFLFISFFFPFFFPF